MDPKRRVFFNSLSGVSLFVLQVAIAFILSPVVVHQLGNVNYGIWDIMLGLMGYSRILDLGLGLAVIRFTARGIGEGDDRRVLTVFNSALGSMAVLGLLNLGLFGLGALRAESILNVEPGSVGHLGLLFLLVGATLCLQFPGGVLAGYLQGRQRHYVMNLGRHVFLLIQSTLFYIALTRWPGSGLLWIAVIFLGTAMVEYGFYAVMVLIVDRRVRISLSAFSWTTLKELYAFGVKSFMLMMSQRVRSQSMPIVIAHVLGVGQVVFFSIPGRLVDYALSFAGQLGQPIMPFFSDLTGRADPAATRRAWLGISRTLQLILLWMALAIFFLGPGFIHRWMGPEYAEKGLWVIRLLSLGFFVEGFGPVSANLLISMGRHGRPSLTALILAVISLGTSILLASRYGLPGAAASLTLCTGLIALVFLTRACREVGIGIFEHLRATALRFLFPLAVSGTVFVLIQREWAPTGYVAILAQAAIAGVAYLALAWPLALTGMERNTLRSLFRRG